MTKRAIILGLLLAVFISGFTYFNDAVIRGTFLIGNFLPLGIYGVLIALLLLLNPLLRCFGRQRVLRGSEVAVIAALGLAACAWPGRSFYHTAVTNVSLPYKLAQAEPSWQSQEVMSYVPGGSARLAPGFVRDWRALAELIVNNKTPAASAIHRQLTDRERWVFRQAASGDMPSASDIAAMNRALNRVLTSISLTDTAAFAGLDLPVAAAALRQQASRGDLSAAERLALNRALLVAAFPELILPSPPGRGMLLAPTAVEAGAVDRLVEGSGTGRLFGMVQWQWWWPVILFWGGTMVVLGLAALCLALIVHPQWSQRELLAYPTARLVQELAGWNPGDWLPRIARHNMFWVAFALVFGIQGWNTLAAWFEVMPSFPVRLDLTPLQSLFPTASRVWGSRGIFNLRIYPTVIAIAFFLDRRVALSLGLANLGWVIFGSLLLAGGSNMNQEFFGGGSLNLMRFGSFVGMAIMIFYMGRRYYVNVAGAALGFERHAETPVYAVWAGRGLIMAVVAAVLILRTGGLGLFWCLLVVALCLLTFLVLSRILAETGAFFLQAGWLPVGVATALFGLEAIGPVAYIGLAMASIMLVGDPRATLMPFLNSGLKMIEGTDGGTSPRKIVPWYVLVIVGSFMVAGIMTMSILHGQGINHHDKYVTNVLPRQPFSQLARSTADLASRGTLVSSTASGAGLDLAAVAPSEGAIFWTILGVGLVLLVAFARIRLPWWPLHPVLFLVWGTYPIVLFGGAFLMGWAFKAAVLKTGGAKGYHQLKPLVIGMVVGDLLAALLAIVISVIYYFSTGKAPVTYSIFSG